jgi:hypothetical protein
MVAGINALRQSNVFEIAATMLRQLCRSHGFEPAVPTGATTTASSRGWCGPGLGIAIIPALGYQPHDGLAVARLESASTYREVFLALSPAVPRPLADAFTAALEQASSALAASAVGISAAK